MLHRRFTVSAGRAADTPADYHFGRRPLVHFAFERWSLHLQVLGVRITIGSWP